MASSEKNFYKVKNWCDAKDNLGIWRMGRIKHNNRGILKVHFDGWSDKWNLHYCAHSPMIAPFRKFSKGYTGQKGSTLREWDFAENMLKNYESKVKSLYQKRFKEVTPYDLTTFLRGDLFIQLDSLMTYTFSNPPRDLELVKQFMHYLLDLLILWLELAPGLYKELKEDYWTHLPTATYNAVYEVFEMLLNILGLNKRTSHFFKKYHGFVHLQSFREAFFTNQGLELYIQILHSPIPIEDTWHFFIQLPKLFSSSTASFNEQCIPQLRDAVLVTLQNPKVLSLPGDFLEFATSLKEAVQLVLDPEQTDSYISNIQFMLRIQPIPSPEPSSIAEEAKAPKVVPKPRPSKDEVSSLGVDEVKGLMEDRHQDCMNLILTKLGELCRSKRKVTSLKKMEVALMKHDMCDNQEYAVLSCIEFLISDNQIQEARRVLKWRQQLISIGTLNGWKVAASIGRQTWDKMEITDHDVIEGNLRYLQDISHFDSSDDESG